MVMSNKVVPVGAEMDSARDDPVRQGRGNDNEKDDGVPDISRTSDARGKGTLTLRKSKSVKFAFATATEDEDDVAANKPTDADKGVVQGKPGAAGRGSNKVHASSSVKRTSTASWLSGLTSSRSKRRRFWRKVAMRLNPRFWVHSLNKRLPIIMPDDPRRRAWDLGVLLLVVYNALLIPYQVGFGTIQVSELNILDRVIDGIFWIDIMLNFRTAYMDHSASMVRDGGKIAWHYIKTWFFIDLIGSIPFDTIVLWFVHNVSSETLIALGLLRTPRLLRLGRLLRFFDRMKGANIIRMIRLLFFMGLVAHWVSCMWFLLYRLTKSGLDWSFDVFIGSNSATITYFLYTYLNSFLLMIGNDVGPQNNLERLYCTIILVIGACFYAIIVGHMSLLVNNMNPTASRHKFKKDIINNTIRYLGAPPDIASRIDEYFDYLTAYTHPGPDGMQLIAQLPSSMFQDIAIWMYKELVTKVPLFKDCEPAFITQLLIRLKLGVFLPGEVIFRNGDVGHEMYFVTKGHVAVLNNHNEIMAELHTGGFFGELALLATPRRTARCVALSHCDLMQLMAHDLVNAMKDFPDSAAKVRAHAMKRLTDLQTAGKVVDDIVQHAVPSHLKKLNPEVARADEDDDGGGPPDGATGGMLPAAGQRGGDGEGSERHSGGPGGAGSDEGVAAYGEQGPGGEGQDAAQQSTDKTAETSDLVSQVQATIMRLTGKIETLQGKMTDIHSRLGRVESAPPQSEASIFNTGVATAGNPNSASNAFFDVDFGGPTL